MIKRHLQKDVETALLQGKIVIIYGARQVGKTTLAKSVMDKYERKIYLNCDDPAVILALKNRSLSYLRNTFSNTDIVVIDEAQRVENIGITAKLIHDELPEIKLMLTGSSSLDLANRIKEPLTGRSVELMLYPLSINEVSNNMIEQDGNIDKLMVYGGYPEIWLSNKEQAANKAKLIANQYLFRDAFALNTIYDQTIMENLLKQLALQIGTEVNYNSLATSLEINRITVMRYVDLLEKAFVIFRVSQFRDNQRVKIGRLRKVYFYDLGMRNALIDDQRSLENRNDLGVLWENFCIIERRKQIQARAGWVKSYYWRSTNKQEIDLIEQEAQDIRAYEFKWSKDRAKSVSGFTASYPNVALKVINRANLHEFLN